MLLNLLVISAIFLGVVNVAVAIGGRNGAVVAFLLSALAAGLSAFALGHLLLAAIAVCVAVAAVDASRRNSPRRWFLVLSLSLTAATYVVVGGLLGFLRMPDWQHYQTEYPLESLADRLAYENRPKNGADAEPCDSDRLSVVEESFDRRANAADTQVRTNSLHLLHAGFVEQFINSPGFGAWRFVGPNPSLI